LRAQNNAEDGSYNIAFNNLRAEVIKLRNEALEKYKILLTLVDKIKEDEASSKAQAEAQNAKFKIFRNNWPGLKKNAY
jgi:GTP-binding protein EngB required for normal cell division